MFPLCKEMKELINGDVSVQPFIKYTDFLVIVLAILGQYISVGHLLTFVL